MHADRRQFIRLMGMSTVLLAPTLVTSGCAEVPDEANRPWREAGGTGDDVRLWALSYAILAPNPHNRQPWIADVRRPGEVFLYRNPRRLLPQTDPFDRQILIGYGCFIELMVQAAAQRGWRAEVEPFPEGEPSAARLDDRPVARVGFTHDEVPSDPLFAQVLKRRSNKEPYDTAKPVREDTLGALASAVGDGIVHVRTVGEGPLRDQLRDITWRAHQIEVRTPRTYQESVDLMRIGKREIVRHRDGIDLGGPMMEALRLIGIMTREKIADPNSSAFQQGLDIYREMLLGTAAYAVLIAPDNGRRSQLEAGRAYLRLNLKATELGLAMHPPSQVLQEYPEMGELQRAFNALIGTDAPARVQMLARLGYAGEVEPSPRRDLKEFVRT